MTVSSALDRSTALARINAAAATRAKFAEALFDAAAEAAEAHDRVSQAVRTAERADAEHAEAYKDALNAGYTTSELAEGGLTAPAKPAKKSRNSKQRTSSRGSATRRRVGLAQQPPSSDPAADVPVSQHHHDTGTPPSPSGS